MSEKHEIVFPDASLNFDDDKRFMPPAHSDFKLNIIKNENGRHGLITNIKGNEKLSGQIQLRGSEIKCIGSCYDIKRRAIIYFIYAVDAYESYHSIIMYSLDTNEFSAILYERPILNFAVDYPVFSTVIGDTLIWTDNYNDIRAINIELALKYIQAVIIPIAPIIISLSEGVGLDFDLSWMQSVGADYYVVGVSVNGNPEVQYTLGKVLTYYRDGYNINDELTVRVRAVNENGSSAWSDAIHLTLLGFLPAAISGLTATAQIESIKLDWVDNSNNEDGFRIYRSTTGSGNTAEWTLLHTALPNVITFTNNVATGQVYYYVVIPYNQRGMNPSLSEAIAGKVFAEALPPVPAVPTGVYATQSGFCAAPNVGSDAVVGATSYQFRRKIGLGAYVTFYSGASRNVFDNDSANVDQGITYYSARACNISGCGSWSADVMLNVRC